MRKKILIIVILVVMAVATATAAASTKPQTYMVQMATGDVLWVECNGSAAEMKVQPGMNKSLLIQCPAPPK